MNKIFEKKREIRNGIEKQRQQLPKAWVESRSSIIIEQLKRLPEFQSAQIIHCYVSWRNEVNTHELIKELLQRGRTVVVPVVEVANRTLLHSRITNFDDLQAGSFGILEPPRDHLVPVKVSELDLIIVPGIAFDLRGYRIGFGGGYYDAFLSQVKATKIGLAFHFQIVEKIPTRPQDEPVDIIISEKGMYRIE